MKKSPAHRDELLSEEYQRKRTVKPAEGAKNFKSRVGGPQMQRNQKLTVASECEQLDLSSEMEEVVRVRPQGCVALIAFRLSSQPECCNTSRQGHRTRLKAAMCEAVRDQVRRRNEKAYHKSCTDLGCRCASTLQVPAHWPGLPAHSDNASRSDEQAISFHFGILERSPDQRCGKRATVLRGKTRRRPASRASS